MPIENLHRWASEVAAHFSLDEDEFSKTMTELFWSTAHIQLSLGYALIVRQDCIFPKGKKAERLEQKIFPTLFLYQRYTFGIIFIIPMSAFIAVGKE